MESLVNGIRLCWEVRGTGVPILCIHGFPLSKALWFPLAEQLAANFRFIVPDLRGLGASEGTPEASLALYADDLAALIAHLGEKRPVVVLGLSMGGYIAFEFFRRHRALVRGLVLADTRAEADSPEAAAKREEMAERVLRQGSHVVAEAMMPKLFAPSAPESLVRHWHDIMAATPRAGVAAALRAMAQRPDFVETLSTIDVPTLVVVGEHDSLTPPADARRIHQGIGGSILKTISHAGHMTPVEAPDQFARVLRDFLQGLGQ